MSDQYGVKRPVQAGGHPCHIDKVSNLANAIDDVKFWTEQGEQAVVVKESIAQDSTWWIEIKGY